MDAVTALSSVTDLERSHNELRAALIIAGREIRRLNFGKRDNAVLNKLRATLRDARKIAAQRRYESRPTHADHCTISSPSTGSPH
jgi:hypothetical protein